VSTGGFDRWVRRHRPASAGRRPLVCFPPAGAAASFFLELAAVAPAQVDPWALALPGREVRIGEPALTEMAALVEAIVSILAPALEQPAILLGHSMGASVAFEVARDLERRRPGSVAHLVVSGRAGPRFGRFGLAAARAGDGAPAPTDEAIVEALRALGGTPPEILDSPDMLELLLPPMRADYALLAVYEPRWRPPLDIPITALVGDSDPTVDLDAVSSWRAVSRAAFIAREVAGGHFYLQSSGEDAADAVADADAYARLATRSRDL
jgi:pyochelin biosynthetic protein PchC